uniref:Uncharacterized protein n=1 Tax=Arundo donax TaxID=35708 RepID=A0A0A8Y0S5_ARUDO
MTTSRSSWSGERSTVENSILSISSLSNLFLCFTFQ